MKKKLLALLSLLTLSSAAFFASCGEEDVQYTVSFSTNGGSTTESVTVKEGDTIELSTPEKAGHTFKGWFADEACTVPFAKDTAINSNLTLYAKWEKNTYTVSISYGELGEETLTLSYGDTLDLSTLTKDNYTCKAWTDNSGNTYAATDKITVVDNLSLTGTFLQVYNVTVVFSGTKSQVVPVVDGETIDLSIYSQAYTGYECLGWSDGENSYATDAIITVNSNMTLTGTFELIPFVYGIANGGTAYSIMNLADSSLTEIEIPATYKGLPVVKIGAAAFKDKNITSVSIPASVTEIGDEAFANTNLQHFTLPETVTNVGKYILHGVELETLNVSFVGETKETATKGLSYFFGTTPVCLKEVSVAYAVSLPMGFVGTSGMADSELEKLTVPFLGEDATAAKAKPLLYLFGDPESELAGALAPAGLKEVNVLGGEAIVDDGFEAFANLEKVTLGDSIKTIGARAFQTTVSKLTNLKLPANLEVLGDYALFGVANWVVVLPDTVKSLGRQTLASLVTTQLQLPSALESVDQYGLSFSEMTNLETLTISDTAANFCTENGVLYNKDKTTVICAPQKCDLGDYALPSTVTKIAARAFFANKTLDVLDFSNVEIIETYAFAESSLTKANLVKATSVGVHAFTKAKSLTEATLPSTLTEIGEHAFFQATALATLTIENAEGITLGGSIFREAKALESVVLPESWTTLPEFLFWEATSLKNVTIKGTIDFIGMAAFKDTALTTVTLTTADEATINPGAFSCATLEAIFFTNPIAPALSTNPNSATIVPNTTAIVVPEGAIEAYKTAWALFPTLTANLYDSIPSLAGDFVINEAGVLTAYNGAAADVILPSNVVTIGEGVFSNHTEIESITLNEGLTTISKKAFSGCSSLVKLIIPSTVTKIEGRASEHPFLGCNSLIWIELHTEKAPAFGYSNYKFAGNAPLFFVTEAAKNTFKGYDDAGFYTISSDVNKLLLKDIENYTLEGATITTDNGTTLVKAVLNTPDYVVPDQITKIGNGAFYQNLTLQTLDLNNVKEIGAKAFRYTKNLKSIDLSKVEIIGESAFEQDCEDDWVISKLTGTLTIPSTVTMIGANAFNWTAYSEIVIENAPAYVLDYAFGNMVNLESINLGKNVRYIGCAFIACEYNEDRPIDLVLPASIIGVGAAFLEYAYIQSVTCDFTEDYANQRIEEDMDADETPTYYWDEYWLDYYEDYVLSGEITFKE